MTKATKAINVGSVVKLTAQGIKKWGTWEAQGGKNGLGVVIAKYDYDSFLHRVEWDNGKRNNYEKGDLQLITEPKPATPKKPRVKLMTSGRRQFDVTFKLAVVRKSDAIKRAPYSKDNNINTLLNEYDIKCTQLHYWRKQHAQGHFSAERAVAFSRKDTMIHG